MKETANFGFKKPENTDFVDVGVFGENFDKIDTELARKTIPIVLNQEIDLTQDINNIDVTEQVEALADRFAVDLKRGTPVSVSLIHQDKPFVFLLTDWFQHREDYFVVWGTSSNPHDITKISRFLLNVFFGQHSDLQYYADIGGSGSGLTPEQAAQIQANTDAIAALPITVNADTGYTEIEKLPRATNIDNVLDGDVLTVTSTLQDGRTIPGTMTFDANGMPESYTEEGVACKFSFTGFEKKVKTVELPVVELSTEIPLSDGTAPTKLTTEESEQINEATANGLPFILKLPGELSILMNKANYAYTGVYHLDVMVVVMLISDGSGVWSAGMTAAKVSG